jgi:hypothetical protein
VEARRKIIQRAGKIARIKPEAKQAAISAGLDDNQQALLVIAAANGRKAQLRKVAKLTNSSADPQDKDNAAEPDADGGEEVDESEQRKVPKLTSSSDNQQDVGNAVQSDAEGTLKKPMNQRASPIAIGLNLFTLRRPSISWRRVG